MLVIFFVVIAGSFYADSNNWRDFAPYLKRIISHTLH